MSALEPGLYRWSYGGKSYDGIIDSDGDFSYLGSDGRHCTRGYGQHDAAHPLIVLDITLADSRLIVANLRDHGYDGFADQIEAQTKPAKIEDPGLWGVVEAGLATYLPESGIRYKWVRHEHYWMSKSFSAPAEWDDLIDPILIRDGIES